MSALSWAWVIAGLCAVLLVFCAVMLVGWYYRLSTLHHPTTTGHCVLCAEPFPCTTLQAIGVTHEYDARA
jgi:hypothetical protein